MSTKDLIERVTSSSAPARSNRAPAQAPAPSANATRSENETRKGGVIRRTAPAAAAPPEPPKRNVPPPQAARGAAPTGKAPAPAGKAPAAAAAPPQAPPRTKVVRRPAPESAEAPKVEAAPVEVQAPVEATPEVRPVVESPRVEPEVRAKAEGTAEVTRSEAAPSEPARAETAPAASESPAAKAPASEAPSQEAAPVATAPAQESPTAEAPKAETKTEAKAEVKAEAKAETKAEAKPETARPTGKAESPRGPKGEGGDARQGLPTAAQGGRPADNRGPRAPQAGAKAPEGDRRAPTAEATRSANIASSLPRADGSGPRAVKPGETPVPGAPSRAHFPGLGSAVVRPPPGYDPNDPGGNRRRAMAAAQATARPAPAQNTRPSGPPQGGQGGPHGGHGGPGGPGGHPGHMGPGGPGGHPGAGGPGGPRWQEADRRPAGGPPPMAEPPGGAGDRAGDARRRPKGRKGDDARRRGEVEVMGMDPGAPGRRRRPKALKAVARRSSPQAKQIKRRVEVNGTITVSQIAHAMSVKASEVIKTLMRMGQMATANDALDFDTATLLAGEFSFEVVNSAFQEDDHMIDVEEADDSMISRPPVVTIMGHVDHGKTTLLDAIRRTKVAASEAGGITQHISSYQVEKDGQLITFIDTPGHAAFTAMRARGAQVTDIVVLVVAADDGVMPQTIEVINHAKAAEVDLIVAVNKCDRPDAKPERIRTQLMEHELVPEEFGGDIMFVNVSALKGQGIDDLLEAILLTSEVGDYRANPERHAEGTVIEARLERGKGPVCVALIQQGTLKRGDHFVVGTTWGRVRALTDANGKALKEAGPSTPVEIMGLEDVPMAGDNLMVVGNAEDAKTLAEHRAEAAKAKSFGGGNRMTLEELLKRGNDKDKLSLNLILRADVGGSLEALKGSFEKISVPGTELKVLHAGVGAVTESDITLAHTNQAVVIAFNVRPDANARRAMDSFGVEVRPYRIIYEALDDVERALKGLLAPTIKEVVQGNATVRQTFMVPKVGMVAGCFVSDGKIARSHGIRLVRDAKVIWEGRLASLKRFKDDVREVASGYECGMGLDGFNDLKVGDVIEAYLKEEVAAV